MPPRGLPTLVVLPPVASSSVAPLSSASFCSATAACRSLALAASPASRRSSALLAAYCGPSSLSSSPLARTTLLTPTPIICRPVMLLLRSTLSSITCTFIDGVGTGVPFGYVVTADDGITTGVSSSSSSSSPAASRSSLRSAWLTFHAVKHTSYPPYILLSLFRPCLGFVGAPYPCPYGDRGCIPHYL